MGLIPSVHNLPVQGNINGSARAPFDCRKYLQTFFSHQVLFESVWFVAIPATNYSEIKLRGMQGIAEKATSKR